MTAVHLEAYFNKKVWAKLLIGTAKGKRQHDKKEAIKERDIRRETDREVARNK